MAVDLWGNQVEGEDSLRLLDPDEDSYRRRLQDENAGRGSGAIASVVPGGLAEQYQRDVDKGERDPVDLNMARMIDRDRASWEASARAMANEFGLEYDPSDVEGIVRNLSYSRNNTGGAAGDAATYLGNLRENYAQRASNTPGDPHIPSGGGTGGRGASGGSGSGSGRSTLSTRPNYNVPGNQFDEAYSSLLEDITRSQIGEVRSNPGLDALMQFLTQRFTDLSTNPGYSPAELAMLNTQVREPIEASRQATQLRELDRTSRAGYLPSSGLTLDRQRQIDTDYDKLRTAADRDLSITALNRRDQNLNQALDIGQLLGLTIPGGQRREELALGNVLYQMPRTALHDALSVINGSPSSGDALSQAIQLAMAQRGSDAYNASQNAALWGQIGQILAGLVR
jgi:hypothetical protein